MRWAIALLLVAAPVEAQEAGSWQRLVSDGDRAKLRSLRGTWMRAFGAAGSHGQMRRAVDPALFDPDRALSEAMPPLGRYRCRRHRLFVAGGRPPQVGGWERCRVEEDKGLRRFVVEGGAERPVGLLYPDQASRAVFLGTLTIGDERRALRYGRDRLRDVAGVIERIGDRRWRLAVPSPSFGEVLDVTELSPG